MRHNLNEDVRKMNSELSGKPIGQLSDSSILVAISVILNKYQVMPVTALANNIGNKIYYNFQISINKDKDCVSSIKEDNFINSIHLEYQGMKFINYSIQYGLFELSRYHKDNKSRSYNKNPFSEVTTSAPI